LISPRLAPTRYMKYVKWGVVAIISILTALLGINKPDSSVLKMVNEIRVENGLSAVRYNSLLGKSAMSKACDMRDKDYITHISPDGKLWELFYDSDYYFKSAGENLARDCTDQDCVTLWMDSPKHKTNILDPRFKEGAISRCGNSLVLHLGTRLTVKEKLKIIIFRIKAILKQEAVINATNT